MGVTLCRITLAFQDYLKYHAAAPRHTLSRLFSNAPLRAITKCSGCPARRREVPAQIGFQVRIVPSGHVRSILDCPPALSLPNVTDVRAALCVPLHLKHGHFGLEGGRGSLLRGRFRTAPMITLFIPGIPLQTTPPTDACMIHSKQRRGCGVQDPGTRGYRRWKTADFSHSARCAPIVTDVRAALRVPLHLKHGHFVLKGGRGPSLCQCSHHRGGGGGGQSPRFCTRPPPPSRSGPKAPWGGGALEGQGWFKDSVGVLQRLGREGCYVGKGNEKFFRAPSAPPYSWPVAIDPW